jgi:hypothetical protein
VKKTVYYLACDSCGAQHTAWHATAPQDALAEVAGMGWTSYRDRLHCSDCWPLCSRCGTECPVENYCHVCGDARGTR